METLSNVEKELSNSPGMVTDFFLLFFPQTTACIVIPLGLMVNSICWDDLRGSHVGKLQSAGKSWCCVSVHCSAVCTAVLPVWSLKGRDECEFTFPPAQTTHNTGCLQPDYSCPEMSQTLASGSEHTLSLTRDPDNTARHTLLSHIAPACCSVVFASLLGRDLPTTAGAHHNRCPRLLHTSPSVSLFYFWDGVN